MQGKNHVALALAAPLGAALVAGPGALPGSVGAWAGLVLGSLAPDIDGEGSICYLGNFLPRNITPKPIITILNGIGKTASGVVRDIFGHRKALHWPTWGFIMTVAGFVLGLDWLIWFGLGYVLHILGDSLTKSGVPLMGPLSTKDISFTPMVTGKFTESAFGMALWVFVGWQIFTYLPHDGWLYQLLYRFGGEVLN